APDELRSLVGRWARGRGPFTTAQVSAWFGVDVEEELRGLEREEKLVRGELRPGGSEREWCDPDVLRRLRRASLAALRREVEPVEQAALGRFLASWHGIDRRASLREALIPLQALALPVALWEAEVLPRRVPDYRAEQLDQLCASGELVWVGAGLDRVAVFFRDDAPLLGRPAGATAPEGEAHDAIRAALAGGALFWDGLLSATELDAETALPALWDLVWSGEVTNDSWSPLRAERRYQPPREDAEPEPLVLAAADPAQPYGAVLPWPKRAGARAARVAGAHVVLLGGEPALFVERGGQSLVPLREPDEEWLRPALAALVGFVKRGGARRP